ETAAGVVEVTGACAFSAAGAAASMSSAMTRPAPALGPNHREYQGKALLHMPTLRELRIVWQSNAYGQVRERIWMRVTEPISQSSPMAVAI
ncbi:MAG: hypothetical protein WA208_15510, partial [Thermoanaerobaculia bacterium]